MNLSAYSQIELKPITFFKNDTLYFGFTEWQFREIIKKKYKLEKLEKDEIVTKKQFSILLLELKTLEEVIASNNRENKSLKQLLALKDETISLNNERAYNTLKIFKKQNKILKITGIALAIMLSVK